MHRGYIKTYRKLVEWEWYTNSNVKSVFIHLLLMVNHKDGKWMGIDVLKGETITSLIKLSQQTGLSIQQVRTSLNKLKKTGEIKLKNNKKHLHVTVCNYQIYADQQHQDNTIITPNQHDNNTKLTTNKNDKNDKNDKHDKNTYDNILDESYKWKRSSKLSKSLNENEYVESIRKWLNGIDEDQWNKWSELYENINVNLEMKKAFKWIQGNLDNRKQQLYKYFNGWLNRTNNKAIDDE
jgi:hypothetical protein